MAEYEGEAILTWLQAIHPERDRVVVDIEFAKRRAPPAAESIHYEAGHVDSARRIVRVDGSSEATPFVVATPVDAKLPRRVYTYVPASLDWIEVGADRVIQRIAEWHPDR